MERAHIVKDIIRHIFTGIILISFFSLPASAATDVLNISISEAITLADEYDGVTLTRGLSSGSGEINITNTLSETALYDISVNFDKGATTSWTTSSSGVNLTSTEDSVTVHINALEAAGSAIITYDCTGSRPVNFSESYNTSRILAGGSVNVSMTLENNASSAITSIQLIKTAADNNSDSTADFTFSGESATSGTPSITGGNVITWDIESLGVGSTATLNFTAADNDENAHSSGGLQSSMQHYLGNATLQFTINNGDVSGSEVAVNGDPTATTLNFEISLEKNQLGESEGGSGGDDWEFTPTITNTDSENISFTISAMTVYVTNSTVLEKDSAIDNKLYGSKTGFSSDNPWEGSKLTVNDFPDPVPVGWIEVDLSADLSGSQLSESYSTTNGTYKLIEKIYIINGYLVEAKKSISKNDTDNQYDITLWVHNLGDLETPPVVYVYDIVPTNFSIVYNETDPDGSTAVSSPIEGYAYWWNVGPLEAEGTPGNETYINYTVEGTGLYRMTDLFILGIDPSYTLNMQSTPVLRNGGLVTSRASVKPVLGMLMMAFLLLGMVGLKKKNREK